MDAIDRRMVATDVLVAFVEEARHRTEREKGEADRLRTLMRAANLAGVKPSELADASGLSRPGVYEVLKGRASGPVPGLDEIVLVVITAQGGSTRAGLADAIGVTESDLQSALSRLIRIGAVRPAAAGYEGNEMDEILLVGQRGERLISEELRHALTRRRDRWVAYLAAEPAEAEALFGAAQERLGSNHVALLPKSLRSDMDSPELALALAVTDAVELFNASSEHWFALREGLGLTPSPIRIVTYSAPSPRSEAFEAFSKALAAAGGKKRLELTQAFGDVVPSGSDFQITRRALYQAAWALRRSLGQTNPPQLMQDGEAAFAELQPVAGLALDGEREKARVALLKGLEHATDTFGPIPAGRLAPGVVVEQVEPTRVDLIEIARRSGEAIGHLARQPGWQGQCEALVRAVATGEQH
jgi:hypothetical protein